jgi:hypothetical protein
MPATPPDVDPAAMGLVVMGMLERSWLMVRHHEIGPTSRSAVVAAATELISRMVD